MKKEECGRSMLELLAVVMVIAILSIVVSYGYRRATSRYESDRVYEQAKLTIASILTKGTRRTDKGMADNSQPYVYSDRAFSVEKDCPLHAFAIRISDVDSDMCEMLMKKDWDYPAKPLAFFRSESWGDLCEGGSNKITRSGYYIKTISDCSRINGGVFALIIPKDRGNIDQIQVCSNNSDCYACQRCNTDRQVCEDNCPTGKRCLKTGDCKDIQECRPDQYVDANGDCHDCPENATCDGEDYTCEDGYDKNVAQEKCDPRPCNGYNLYSCPDHGTCFECLSGNTTKYRLDRCDTGYRMQGNSCIANICTSVTTTPIEHCTNQTTCVSPTGTYYTCTACELGYTLSENSCSPSDCSSFSSTDNCNNVEHKASCTSCYSAGVMKYKLTCQNGYEKSGNSCVCTASSCKNGKYCDASGNCRDCETPAQSCRIQSDVVNQTTGCTTTQKVTCTSGQYCGTNGQCQNCGTQTSCTIAADTTDSNGCTVTKVNCSDTNKLCLPSDGSCVNSCPSGTTPSNGHCCPNATPIWDGEVCTICTTNSQCGEGKYCDNGTCPSCGTPIQSCAVESDVTDDTTGCVTTQKITCSGNQVCNTSTGACDSCPTNSSYVSGEAPTNRMETGTVPGCYCNANVPYWDYDNQVCTSTPKCSAAMIAAGLKSWYFSVSGNTVTWDPSDKREYMSPTQKLDLTGCNLVLKTRLKNSNKITVNNLTLNHPADYDDYASSYNEEGGTIVVNGKMVLESSNIEKANFINQGNMTVKGNVEIKNFQFRSSDTLGNLYIKGNVTSDNGLFYNGGTLTVDGYVDVACSARGGFSNSGNATIKGYLKGKTTAVSDGASNKGVENFGTGRLVVYGNITGIGVGGVNTGISVFGSTTYSGGSIMRSLNGNIKGEGGRTGIAVASASFLIAENGYIEGTGGSSNSSVGISVIGYNPSINPTIEAKGNVTGTIGNNNGLDGIEMSYGTIKAGGGVTGTNGHMAGLAVYGSTLISCGDVSGSGNNGVVFGAANSDYGTTVPNVQIKGQVSGSASRSDYSRYYRIFFSNGVTTDHVKARSFATSYDPGSDVCYRDYDSRNGYCEVNYPSNPTYTPDWCNNMQFTQ